MRWRLWPGKRSVAAGAAGAGASMVAVLPTASGVPGLVAVVVFVSACAAAGPRTSFVLVPEEGVFISASMRTSRICFLVAGGVGVGDGPPGTESEEARRCSWFAHSVQEKVSPT